MAHFRSAEGRQHGHCQGRTRGACGGKWFGQIHARARDAGTGPSGRGRGDVERRGRERPSVSTVAAARVSGPLLGPESTHDHRRGPARGRAPAPCRQEGPSVAGNCSKKWGCQPKMPRGVLGVSAADNGSGLCWRGPWHSRPNFGARRKCRGAGFEDSGGDFGLASGASANAED